MLLLLLLIEFLVSRMLLLLAVSLAVVGVSPGLSLGAGQCSWGPAYWCANIPQVTLLLDVSCT